MPLKATCPTCERTYEDPLDVEYMYEHIICLLCEKIKTEIDNDTLNWP
jgi:hydrogenase maturation factor HypF (carbamoyltransferase family)